MNRDGRITRREVLEYHADGRAGKLEIRATKPLISQRDYSLAYTPGVAQVVEVIDEDPAAAYKFTAKGNLVAVVSNGTAILGLGDRGPVAAKPVMEGKALLFKQLADVDVFDIELQAESADEIVRVVAAIAPGFGGINLEDIAAPTCFEVEERLRKNLDIPVFHDDQHGTAIITSAALVNAMHLSGKDVARAKVVIIGAGAAGIACARMFVALGISRQNILMFDRHGLIRRGRPEGMNRYKLEFAQDGPDLTVEEGLVGADVLLGLSAGNTISPSMLKAMAPQPILLLLANPDPEIRYELALAARPDAIVATGRSDYPNQVNNVLGFPFIFRGALDVQASTVNEEMKRAAAEALAALTREVVPESVLKAYGLAHLKFGRDYIIPKPNDYRVLEWVASAVAEAAMRSGVAQATVDLSEYRERLRGLQHPGRRLVHSIVEKAVRKPKRLIFVEGEHEIVIRAARRFESDGFGHAVLLGRPERIADRISELGLQYQPEIVDPATSELAASYAAEIYRRRQRKGVDRRKAQALSQTPEIFGLMMLQSGHADALLVGVDHDYQSALQPILQHIPLEPNVSTATGVFVVMSGRRLTFIADSLVNIDPDPHRLAEIAIRTADFARDFDVEPRVAMVSFSNFGASRHASAKKMRQAVEIIRELRPDLPVDGEMQADVALSASIAGDRFPFSRVQGANVLIFPNLDASTAAFKVASHLGGAYSLGPVLLGPSRSAHVLQPSVDVRSIVLMGALAGVEAERRSREAESVETSPRNGFDPDSSTQPVLVEVSNRA